MQGLLISSWKYKSLPSFQETFSQGKEPPKQDVFLKVTENEWRMKSYLPGAVNLLQFIGRELEMEAIFETIPDL